MSRLLLSLLLVGTAFAGCIGEPIEPASIDEIRLDPATLPEGARLETLPEGVRLVWETVEAPFRESLTIPEGTTLARITAEAGATASVVTNMWSTDTERRRCNLPYLTAWDEPTVGKSTCSGATAMDDLPTEWTFYAGTPGSLTQAGVLNLVSIEFLATPYDGLMAKLDLTQISKPVFEVRDPEPTWIESFDGARLYTEVTLPEGEGPWPTIVSSSPYNGDYHMTGVPSMWAYFTHDWAKRGYAVVNVDVRGFGNSGGCVEVWGENEQKDQAVVVDWVAAQDWSDGNVGFYGQSYVGTTPVAAAVQAPEALKAIIAVAPVTNAYDDWHFGGVPNGENAGSPVSYQVLTDGTSPYTADPVQLVNNYASSVCDPTLTLRANDPRGLYDEFYEIRNFSARAGNVKAAVLYTQGFEDTNVKSSMIPRWFNAITAPKLGLFGHWVHQHPTRADNEVLFLGWMDQYVKGKPVGFDEVQPVSVVTNAGTHRTAETWPPADAGTFALHADLAGGKLADAPTDGAVDLLLTPAGDPASALGLPIQGGITKALTTVTLESEPVAEPVHFAGTGVVQAKVTLRNAENAHLAAYLHEVDEDGSRLVTWGMFNLAHRNGHDQYAPLAPGETVTVGIPLLPTEWVFEEGKTLRLEIRSAGALDWFLVQPAEPALAILAGGADGTALVLPTVDGVTGVEMLPATLQR